MQNKILTIAFLLVSFTSSLTYAGVIPEVGSAFNYQGELIDNGKPANGSYDFRVTLFDAPSGAGGFEYKLTFTGITVENGLFLIENIDFPSFVYDGFVSYIEIEVRKGGFDPTYVVLSPRHKINAVPYATSLTNNGASNGDVYTFTGGEWQAASNNHTSYTAGQGISVAGNTITNTGDTDASDDVEVLDDLSDVIQEGFSLFVGEDSGVNNVVGGASSGKFNVAVGGNAMNSNISGQNNTAIGNAALASGTNSTFNTAMGYQALLFNSGNGNTAVGASALETTTGASNTAIGYNAGKNTTGTANVFIGNEAGKNEAGSNKLYIDNSDTTLPLIGGDFSNNYVNINGKLGIGIDPEENISIQSPIFTKIGMKATTTTGASMLHLKGNDTADNYSILAKRGTGVSSTTASGAVSRANLTELYLGPDAGSLLFNVVPTNPMYFATDDKLRMTIEDDGDILVNEKITAPDSGDFDMKAYIYGSLNSAGNFTNWGAHSGGFTVDHTGTGIYEINFNNSPNNTFYTVLATMRFDDIGFITVHNFDDNFRIRTYNITGVLTNKAFNFVVYKK